MNNSNLKQFIPQIIYPERPDFVELYFKAWQLAYDHIVDIEGMPHTPYMDEGFCNTDIWIWDTCFMSLFCKYAQNAFPGYESLNNFYAPRYNSNSKLPAVIAKNPPDWTSAQHGMPFDMLIHIVDNPPLFAWAEYENALFSGDVRHVEALLLEKKYLQKHFEFLENLFDSHNHKGVRCMNYWRKRDNGYLWEGGASGMDNTPRGRTASYAMDERPNNPHMLWIDAISQQGCSAYYISKLFKLLKKDEYAELWSDKYYAIRKTINKYYWDSHDGFYYDIDERDCSKIKVQTLASFWPLLSKMASCSQAKCLSRFLENPNKFGGKIPLVTLSRDDIDFKPNGGYWRGGVWIPTAYMSVKGIENYGYFSLAKKLSESLLNHMVETYHEYSQQTIWECYHPFRPEPGRYPNDIDIVRPDFCGWSALAPISLMIENVIGIHYVNAFTKEIAWSLDYDKPVGINNLRFGKITTDLFYHENRIIVKSSGDYSLTVNGTNHTITCGSTEIKIS